MNAVEIISPGINELHREVFVFGFGYNGKMLYVDSYSTQERQSTRHKWSPIKIYERVSHGGNYLRNSILKASEVPLTEEIKKKALEKLMSEINVGIWEK